MKRVFGLTLGARTPKRPALVTVVPIKLKWVEREKSR